MYLSIVTSIRFPCFFLLLKQNLFELLAEQLNQHLKLAILRVSQQTTMELMDLENLENSQISSALDKIIKRNNPSRIQRVLSALLLVLCFLIVVLVVCFCLMLLHPKLLHDWASYYLSWESKCLSPVCITQAADTMRRMDKSVDPCTDFYQFSCGGLDNKYNVIPDQDNTLGTTSVSQLEIDKRIKGEYKSI